MDKVNVNGVQIAYQRRGSGVPLVLLHGYPLDHTIWDEVVPLLEGDFELILPDLRGFGQSELVEAQYTIADMAADVAALLDELGIENTYIAGHSMGGYISLAFVRNYRERVLGLGLIASQALGDSPERKDARYASAEEIMRTGVQPVVESMTPKLTPDEGVQDKVRGLIAEQHPTGLANAMKAMGERFDSTLVLATFRFPVVIVHGTADELIPIDRAREIKAVIKPAYLVELSGVGHVPMLEDPEETADSLKKFVPES
jgi:pimeloyl-ACP methyl ester carboxylesterase